MPSIAEAFITLRPDLSQFENQTRGYFRARAGVFTAIGAAAVAAGAVLAVAKPAAEVEQQLNILQATANATAGQMKQMADRARELGKDLTLPATSSKDAAEAMTELAKGGLAVNDILGASKGVLQLAAAGQLSNASAAQITANALNAFGLAGSQAVRVADLLAAASKAATGEVSDMADALQMSGAIFAGANIPIADLVTLISELAKAGIQGSDAGTSLKQMLIQVQAPSKKTRELMDAIGFSIYDAAGNMKSMRQVIADLAKSTTGMTQEARDFTLAQVFGADATRAANVLLREGVGGFDAMQRAVTEEGAAASLAAARNKGLLGAFDGFKSAVSTLAIDIGTKLLPRMTEAVRSTAGLVNQASTLGPVLREIGTGAAIGFGVAKQAAKDLFDFLKQNQAAAFGAIAAVAAIGAAIVLSLGPVSLAMLAIAGITAALVGFNTKWDEVFKKLPAPVKLAFADVLDATAEWAMSMSLTFNAVAVTANHIANGIIAITKVGLLSIATMRAAAGQFSDAARIFKLANDLKLNQPPTFSAEDIRATMKSQAHLMREQGEASMRQAAVDAFEAAAKAAAAAAAGGDVDAETASRLDAARKALAAASGGAKTSIDDLIAAAGGAGDAVKTLAERMKEAAQSIEAEQTSDVVKAFFDAMIKGTDPDAAISQARAVISQQDTVWAQLVGTLHDKLGIEVPDEFRAMWEQMTEATKNGARDTFTTWRDELKQRLASVGRLLPNMGQRVGDTVITYNITVPVSADAAGRIDTKRLVDEIAGATVEARRRTSMAELR